MDRTALFKITYGLYVTGVKNAGGFGGCVVDAFMQTAEGAEDSPPAAALSSMRATFSNALIKESGVFTLSVLPADVDPAVIANFGFKSARKADKWAIADHETRDGLPVLKCACAALRLRVTETKELATHSLFLCEIEDAWAGAGDPLLYAEYQRSMKPAALAAMKRMMKNE